MESAYTLTQLSAGYNHNGGELLDVTGHALDVGLSYVDVNSPPKKQRRLQSKLDDFVSVKDYGAVGDGTTDDTDRIQEALSDTSSPCLYFPAGTYSCRQLSLTRSCTLRGENATLKLRASQPSNSYVLYVSGNGLTVSVEGLGFDANVAVQSVASGIQTLCFQSTGSTTCNIAVAGCTFDNQCLTSISCYGQTSNQAHLQGTVSNCVFRGGENGNGIIYVPRYVSVNDTARFTVTACTFDSLQTGNSDAPAGVGVFSTSAAVIYYTQLTVTSCQFRGLGCTASGCVDLYAWGQNCVISDNRFSDIAGTAGVIRMKDSVNGASVTGNCILNHPNGNAIDVLPNTLAGATSPYNSKVVISDNVVNNVKDGISLSESGGSLLQQVSVTGNVIDTCRIGIYLQAVDQVIVSGNTISNASFQFAQLVLNTTTNRIAFVGNTMRSAGSYGIYVNAAQSGLVLSLESNIIDSPTAYGVYLDGCASASVRDNHISNVALGSGVQVAVRAINCSSLALQQNTASGTFTSQFVDAGGNGNVLDQNNSWEGQRLYGSAAPVAGTFAAGDSLLLNTVALGGPERYVCVAGGSPGTWAKSAPVGVLDYDGSDNLYMAPAGTRTVFASNVPSAVNLLQLTGAATGAAARLGVAGNSADADAPLLLFTRGTGDLFLEPGLRGGLTVYGVASSVNYLGVSPSISGNGVAVSAQGTDADVDLIASPKGAGLLRINTASSAAAVPANFSAARYLPLKDSSGVTYYVPLASATW